MKVKVYDNTMCKKLDDRQSRRQKSSISSSNCLDEYAKFYSRKENVYELSLSLSLHLTSVYLHKICFEIKRFFKKNNEPKVKDGLCECTFCLMSYIKDKIMMLICCYSEAGKI